MTFSDSQNHQSQFLCKQAHSDSEAVVQRFSAKKGVLKIFKKLTGKHLCHSRFLNKVVG